MGAGFLLYCMPEFKPTAERRKAFRRMLSEMSTEERERFADYACAENDCDLISHALDAFDSICSSRETTSCKLEEHNYYTIFTGGLSWGDYPTEAADWMSTLGSLPPNIYSHFRQWAIEDFAQQAKQKANP